jgi:hypothetical protein
MRDILNVTYIPKEQEDQSYTTYETIYTISNKLEPIESGEVLWLYLTIIDNINLRIRAAIWADHDTIMTWTEKHELLLWMRQNISIVWYTPDQSTIINKIWEEKPTSGLSLIKTFNEACHLVLAINDGSLNEIPRHDRIVMINRGDESNFLNTGSLKNIARIFADKI